MCRYANELNVSCKINVMMLIYTPTLMSLRGFSELNVIFLSLHTVENVAHCEFAHLRDLLIR